MQSLGIALIMSKQKFQEPVAVSHMVGRYGIFEAFILRLSIMESGRSEQMYWLTSVHKPMVTQKSCFSRTRWQFTIH